MSIDLTKPYYTGDAFFSGIRVYKVPLKDSVWTVTNTGNVPLVLNRFFINTTTVDTSWNMNPGSSITIIIPTWADPDYGFSDPTNTVFDSHKFAMDQPTGYIPFQIYRY